MKISNQPPKGTSDWLPSEFAVRKYIFDTWREVCKSYGYQEYLTPVIESADIYRAKSGEDVGNKELMVMVDRAGRELAIRPEMTPSVTRMVSKIYESAPKPIRYFSIANFLRNEKPQRGRNREFWQLNFDLFGSENINADIEIIQIAIAILLKFNAPEGSFKVMINNRKLIDEVLQILNVKAELRTPLLRTLDKWSKLSAEDFNRSLEEIGLEKSVIENVVSFMECKDDKDLIALFPGLKGCTGYSEIEKIISTLSAIGMKEYVTFNPAVIRGLDYYDGTIFEVFDMNSENSRAMFGGGRYNGLADIFGAKSFPAVGCAPGDETTKLFLESWNLVPKDLLTNRDLYFMPILDETLTEESLKIADKLRSEGYNIEIGVEVTNISKALKYADKNMFTGMVIYGSEEAKNGKYQIKSLKR